MENEKKDFYLDFPNLKVNNESDFLSNNDEVKKNFKKANLDLFNNNNTSNYIFEESSIIKNKNNENNNNIYLGNLKPFCYNKKTGIPIITIGPHCNIFNYK